MTPTRPLLMGILNVTPDSFSDGGLFLNRTVAIDAAMRMVEDGADIIDVGGESSRPGAEPVEEAEEMCRVLPVIEALLAKGLTISIDTMKPGVAKAALVAGATILNDVTALRDPAMAEIAARSGCTICLMHMQGEPRTMQKDPQYRDVVAEVRDFLLSRAEDAQRRGVAKERIWLDPGIGFGKTTHHNLSLLKHLDVLVQTGYPILVGVSRKAFIGRILGSPEDPLPTSERLEGTLAVQVLAQASGAALIRAHDVRESRRAINLATAVMTAD